MDDLFGHVPEKPRARKTDPWTSHAAAERAVEFFGTHKQKISAYLRTIYPRAATPEQIGEAVGLTVEQVDRRRAGMIGDGLIAVVATGKMSNGNDAGLWRHVPEKKEQ